MNERELGCMACCISSSTGSIEGGRQRKVNDGIFS
jgi:hypothetical protein